MDKPNTNSTQVPTATPAAAAPPAATPAPAPSPGDELRDAAREFFQDFDTGGQPAAAAAAAAAAPAASPAPAPAGATHVTPAPAATPAAAAPAAAAGTPAASAVETKVKLTRRPGAAPLDIDRVAEATARAVVETQAALEAQRRAQQTAEPLTPEQQEEAQLFEELARINPQRYRGVGAKMAEHRRQEAAYADAWEAAHPGEQFDGNDQEHARWYAAHPHPVGDADVERAKVRMEARREVQEGVGREMADVRRQLRVTRLGPEARQAGAAVAEHLFRALQPQHQGPITRETVTAAEQADPLAFDVSAAVAGKYGQAAEAAVMLWEGAVDFDARNPAHAAAVAALRRLETKLAQLPAEATANPRGQTWVPLARYERMTAAQQARHYTTGRDDVVDQLAVTAKLEFTENLQHEQSRQERYGKRNGQSGAAHARAASPTPPGPAAAAAAQPAGAQPASLAPSVSLGSPVSVGDGTSGAASAGEENPLWAQIGV